MKDRFLLVVFFLTAGCAQTPAPTETGTQGQSRPMKFVCEQYGEDQWQWKLIGGNGEPLGWSEGYTTRASCLRAASRAKEGAVDAIVDRRSK